MAPKIVAFMCKSEADIRLEVKKENANEVAFSKEEIKKHMFDGIVGAGDGAGDGEVVGAVLGGGASADIESGKSEAVVVKEGEGGATATL